MKRNTAKEILAESFREIAEKKPVDKITVKDITDNCGYSSATFYRQFKDKYDLIAWDYATGLESEMSRIGSDYPWKKTLIMGAKSYDAYRDYLSNLLAHTSGHDSFVKNMTDMNFNALKKHILASTGIDRLDHKTEMYIRIYCLGTVNLSCEWISGKFKATPEEIAEIYENSLPTPLAQYLL